MKNEVIPQVLVETMPYQRAVEKIWDIETQMEFKIYIGLNPYSGNLIPERAAYGRFAGRALEEENAVVSV